MRIFALAFMFLLVATPSLARAAWLQAERSGNQDASRIVISLLATTTPINGVEGSIRLPAGARTERLYTGGSFIQTWVEAPRETGGIIRFAGIIPGGFTGSAVAGAGLTGPAELFSFEIIGVQGPLVIENGAVYLNDGMGTRIALEDAALGEVLRAGGARQEEDRTPPEYVDATLVTDPSIAEGRAALLISGYDAGSGIDRFEVQEGAGAWAVAQEAYEIQDQSGLKPLSVRAYDRAGNFIETRVDGKNANYAKLGYALGGLILLILVLMLTVYFGKRRRA